MPKRRPIGQICYLGNCQGNAARELGDQIDRGDVTHAVMLFRTRTGGIRLRLVGRKDMTYLLGMMTQAAITMQCDYQYLLTDRGSG